MMITFFSPEHPGIKVSRQASNTHCHDDPSLQSGPSGDLGEQNLEQLESHFKMRRHLCIRGFVRPSVIYERHNGCIVACLSDLFSILQIRSVRIESSSNVLLFRCYVQPRVYHTMLVKSSTILFIIEIKHSANIFAAPTPLKTSSFGLQNRVAVATCQERYMILVKNYIESIRSYGEAIYLVPKILAKVGELR